MEIRLRPETKERVPSIEWRILSLLGLICGARIKKTIGIKRLNRDLIYNLSSELICGYPVQPMVSPIPNAYADGSKIYITIATLDFIKDDQEIAFLISHELAHNIVHYNGKGLSELDAKPIPINDKPSLQSVGDLFIFQSGAKETEADLLGVEYAIKGCLLYTSDAADE